MTVHRHRSGPRVALSWMAHRCAYPPMARLRSPTSELWARLFRPHRTRLRPRHHASAIRAHFSRSKTTHELTLGLSAGTLTAGLHRGNPSTMRPRIFSANAACALHGLAASTANAFKLSIAVNEKEGGGSQGSQRHAFDDTPSFGASLSADAAPRARASLALLAHRWRRTCSARTPAGESRQPGAVQHPTASQSIAPSEPSEMTPRLTHPRHP